jgi:hypothetical protein
VIDQRSWLKLWPSSGASNKTIHALTYIDGETKSRRILNQLNKGEDRHKLAGVGVGGLPMECRLTTAEDARKLFLCHRRGDGR